MSRGRSRHMSAEAPRCYSSCRSDQAGIKYCVSHVTKHSKAAFRHALNSGAPPRFLRTRFMREHKCLSESLRSFCRLSLSTWSQHENTAGDPVLDSPLASGGRGWWRRDGSIQKRTNILVCKSGVVHGEDTDEHVKKANGSVNVL